MDGSTDDTRFSLISDDIISLKICTLDVINCIIHGTKDYNIKINFNNKEITHNCLDYLHRRSKNKKFCKHLVKMFQFLEKEYGANFIRYVLSTIGTELTEWKFI